MLNPTLSRWVPAPEGTGVPNVPGPACPNGSEIPDFNVLAHNDMEPHAQRRAVFTLALLEEKFKYF